MPIFNWRGFESNSEFKKNSAIAYEAAKERLE